MMDEKYRDIVLALSEVYKPEGAIVWMFSPHKLLGGQVPVDVIAEGRGDVVAGLVDQLQSGAFI